MRLTKFGHACIRVEHDGHTLVVDPGMFTDPEAVDGADVVLVTHLHPDHLHPDNLRRTDARILTIAEVAEQIRADAPDLVERVTVVGTGRGCRCRTPRAGGRASGTPSSIRTCRGWTTAASS